MATPDWMTRIEAELDKAEQARAAGNEGMARVCARRAAGIAVGEYLTRRGFEQLNPSAYERLKALRTIPGLPERVYRASELLLLRVTPDHKLPVETDLLAEARGLVWSLLGDRQAEDL